MRLLTIRRNQYIAAVLFPLLGSAATWYLHGVISAANIALLFIVIVIVTAINTSTGPALVSALVSFLAFNVFFTEPRGSFLVLHDQDLLTIGLFLVTALVVGQLAARLREQLAQLQEREHFSNIELVYLEKLSVAIDQGDILAALENALSAITDLEFQLLPVRDNRVEWEAAVTLSPELRESVTTALGSNPPNGTGEMLAGAQTLHFLHDRDLVIALLIGRTDTARTRDSVRLLAHQSDLALTRMRLVADLEQERLAKDHEVMRSSLLSSVSHDFRTPLTSMVGAASTLLDLGEQLEQEQKVELLQSILLEARRLNSYTQKLLDLTRLGKGELSLNRSTLAIEEVLNIVFKRIRQQFQDQVLKLHLPPGLPVLAVHAALIEQALYNAIENACKFTRPDSSIHISCSSTGNQLLIDIEDSGPGVPDTDKERVFEMFHSADRGDRRAAGSGLGLAISKGMVNAHGGSIQILDSSRYGGCLVRIALPVNSGELT